MYEISSRFDCRNELTSSEKCLTELTLVAADLKTIPQNLFANTGRRLTFFNVSNCGLSDIFRDDFRNADALIELDLSRNRITELSNHLFDFLKNIQIINLSNNLLGVDSIQSDAFEKCLWLKQLNLSNNYFFSLLHDGAVNWIASLRNLQVLNLNSHMDFERDPHSSASIFYENTNLVSLFAENWRIVNDVNDLDELIRRLPNIRHLIMAKVIDRPDISIFHIDFPSTLDISGQQLNELHVTNRFEIIDASHNAIEFVNFATTNDSDNNNIGEFYVSNNKLSNIDFVQFMPNLRYADFSSNNLRILSAECLKNLKNLIKLNLANNQLEQFDFNVVQRLPVLKTFDVSYNLLQIDLKLYSNTSIEVFNLIGNQFANIDFYNKTVKIRQLGQQ